PKFNVAVSDINTGINAEAKLVALANPKWMSTLKIETIIIVAIIGIESKPSHPNDLALNHRTTPVFRSKLPNEIPAPNTMTVPQGMYFTASSHLITPILGINITAIATNVSDDESKGCNTFSVAQPSGNNTEIK